MDAAEIATRFDLGSTPRLSDGPVARGMQGQVWRLDTADGRWAVKVRFRPLGEADVRLSTARDTAAALQEACAAAGVPTPRVRRTIDGHLLADTTGGQVSVQEWVDVLSPDSLLDPGLVGETLAMMHGVQVPATDDPDSWHHEPVGAHAWDDLLRLLWTARAPFADRLAGLRDELVALDSWVEPPAATQTCHRDLWADNLLPTPGGGVCVLDFDESGPADPSRELACVLFEFGRTDRGRARELMAAYRDAGGQGVVSRRSDFSMLVAQLGHITQLAAQDWMTSTPRLLQRDDAADLVVEVLNDPHARGRLDTRLGWVQPT